MKVFYDSERTSRTGEGFDLEFDDHGALRAFEQTWALEPDVLQFGDTGRLPEAILIHELLLAMKSREAHLFVGGQGEVSDDEFEDIVGERASRTFVDVDCAEAFAFACYRSLEKRRAFLAWCELPNKRRRKT